MRLSKHILNYPIDDGMLGCLRATALSGNEPSDAIRVVNALLTQIDQLKVHILRAYTPARGLIAR